MKTEKEILEIVDTVIGWFDLEEDQDARNHFLKCTKDELIQYHHSLGQNIRNEFGLWGEKWVPVIIDGCDMSEQHPDAVSMKIIEIVWEKLHNSGYNNSIET